MRINNQYVQLLGVHDISYIYKSVDFNTGFGLHNIEGNSSTSLVDIKFESVFDNAYLDVNL